MMAFTTETEVQFVVFKLGDEEFGIPITQVKEINRLTTPTKIPKSPGFVEGVINLRGQIIPIVDLRKRFEMGLADYSVDARVIVVEIKDQICGIIVDAVSEVLRMPTNNIEPTPSLVSNIDVEYIAGVGKIGERLLIVLDINKLLSDEEHLALIEIGNTEEE